MEQPYVAYALLPSLIQRLAPRPRSGHRERDGYACTSVLDVAGDSTARDPGRVSAARASFGQDEPSPAVDELTHHVEMTGVACGLGHHMQDNFPQIVKAPVAEEVGGPPGRWGIQRSGGDDGVRAVDLLPVQVEHSRGRHIHPDDAPGVVGGVGQCVDGGLLAGDNTAEPELLDIQGEMLYQSQAGPP